jgi:hypothetical protein
MTPCQRASRRFDLRRRVIVTRALPYRGLLLILGACADGELVKVVIVSRHGVRTPLETKAALDDWTRRPGGFPAVWNPAGWPHDKPGDLTQAGTELATLMGGWYGSRYGGALLPAEGCPSGDDLFIRADVDERTVETGKAIAAGLAGLNLTESCRVSRRQGRSLSFEITMRRCSMGVSCSPWSPRSSILAMPNDAMRTSPFGDSGGI